MGVPPPTAVLLASNPKKTHDRFWAKTVPTAEGCLLWTASTRGSHGYGAFWNGEKMVAAHRWAYEACVGPIPEGAVLLHACDRPLCVEPRHLTPGTHRQNVEDKVQKRRHATGTRSTSARLTSEQVEEIRTSSASLTTLALQFGVSRKTIWNVKHRKRYG